jgi:hypothetical protein
MISKMKALFHLAYHLTRPIPWWIPSRENLQDKKLKPGRMAARLNVPDHLRVQKYRMQNLEDYSSSQSLCTQQEHHTKWLASPEYL